MDTNKQTPRQAKYIYSYIKYVVIFFSVCFMFNHNLSDLSQICILELTPLNHKNVILAWFENSKLRKFFYRESLVFRQSWVLKLVPEKNLKCLPYIFQKTRRNSLRQLKIIIYSTKTLLNMICLNFDSYWMSNIQGVPINIGNSVTNSILSFKIILWFSIVITYWESCSP